MNLSIEVAIDEDLARYIAEKLGMQMETITDPDAPAVPVTLEEVDTFLEGEIKKTVVAQYAGIIKDRYTQTLRSELVAQESDIDKLLDSAVSTGKL